MRRFTAQISASPPSPRRRRFADRFIVRYACPNGHSSVTLSSESLAPATWECRVANRRTYRRLEEDEDNKPVKPQRTYWDMLLERRSIGELEIV